MPRILSTIDEVAGEYDALFVDLWGCLHNGVKAHPSAVAALQRFAAHGGKVVLLTNAPRPRGAVRRQIARLGVPEDAYHDIATSGDAAQFGMLSGLVGSKVHHIGAPRDETFFTDLPEDAPNTEITRVALAEAEGIVCTGLFDDLSETPDDYRATLLHAKTRGLKLLCANPDIVVDFGEKRLYCAGALAEAYTAMGGESLYFGKPHPPIYDLARRRLAALPGAAVDPRILCIGDGLATDVRGALQESLDVVFVTGGLAAEETATTAQSGPDPERLAATLAAARVSADYAIGFLG